HNGGTGVTEPQDRIDFVYAAGPVRTLRSSAVVYGTPKAVPDHKGNEWSSDHAAVVSKFSVE
ncbi:MAG: endonuclease/exonuclease/phosphatase family protein, partial [Actinomycetota bacterium]|nr:endonuclease/exonuclease/phosphatase family protein [Actinomycetota bacterium]